MLTDNLLPTAIEAERAVIAAMLYDNVVYEQVGDFLKSEHFFDPIYQRIYTAIVHCIQIGQIANPITVWPFFVNEEGIKERGGEDYLNKLAKSILSVNYVADYGRQVLDAHIRRELMRVGNEVIESSSKMELGNDAFNIIESTESKLFNLSNSNSIAKNVKSFKTVLADVINQTKIIANSDNHTIGVATGLIDVDRHLGGLHKSDLVILAGRPSMGKTALATNIAFNAAHGGNKSVVFFSLEMSAEQLAMRILAQESGISSDRIRRGAIGNSDLTSLVNASKRLANAPFFIDDTPSLSMAGLRTRARRLLRQEKISLIVIDYLQLLTGGGTTESRVQELSFITRSLKALAKELNVPVLALSQLSRAVELRDDKRPQLSDLRESGTIEQDADVVMFVFRESYYESRKKPPDGSPKMNSWQENMSKIHDMAELIIAKQRHGPIKTINLHYQDSLTKFGNWLAEDS